MCSGLCSVHARLVHAGRASGRAGCARLAITSIRTQPALVYGRCPFLDSCLYPGFIHRTHWMSNTCSRIHLSLTGHLSQAGKTGMRSSLSCTMLRQQLTHASGNTGWEGLQHGSMIVPSNSMGCWISWAPEDSLLRNCKLQPIKRLVTPKGTFRRLSTTFTNYGPVRPL